MYTANVRMTYGLVGTSTNIGPVARLRRQYLFNADLNVMISFFGGGETTAHGYVFTHNIVLI